MKRRSFLATAFLAPTLHSASNTGSTSDKPLRHHYQWPAISQLRVAPGLRGYGTETEAGRHGKVIVVTTLAASGPGSFAEAMATKGPRQIIFDVAGAITMPPGGLTIAEGHVSVYGQTAPGDGIEFRASNNDGFPNTKIRASHVFMQHVRFRTGAGPAREGGWAIRDGLNIGHPQTPISHIVLDHISASWGTDEIFDCFGATSDITLSNSLFYENLVRSTDNYGTSGRSVFFNDRSRRISMHRCVIAKSTGRMPMIQSVFDFDVFNNILYGYTKSATEVQVTNDVNVHGSIDLNLYIDTYRSSRAEIRIYPKAHRGKGQYLIHANGNGRQTGAPGSQIKPARTVDSFGAGFSEKTVTELDDYRSLLRPPAIPIENLEDQLLSHVGASKPARDSNDQRIIEEITTRSGSLIDCVAGRVITPANQQCERNTHHSRLTSGPSRLGEAPDFVPLNWKQAQGLPPTHDASTTDSNNDGYLDIEDWFSSLAQ